MSQLRYDGVTSQGIETDRVPPRSLGPSKGAQTEDMSGVTSEYEGALPGAGSREDMQDRPSEPTTRKEAPE